MNSRKKHILLDIGGVLLHLDFGRAAKKLESFSEHDIEVINELIVGDDKNSFERGRLSEYKFYKRITGKLQAEMSYQEFNDLWCDIFSENIAMSSLVKVLAQNLDLILFSNTNPLHFNHILDNYPFIGEIKHRALSYEMGLLKPDRRFFEQTLRKFRLNPSLTLLIDDSAENIATAEQIGIAGIIYRDHNALLDQLNHFGIPLHI